MQQVKPTLKVWVFQAWRLKLKLSRVWQLLSVEVVGLHLLFTY